MMQTKQLIIFRRDLLKGEHGIRKGKFGAQCAHASLCAFLTHQNDPHLQDIYNDWTNGIYTKVVLGATDESELLQIQQAFKDTNEPIPMALITDIGKTEFHNQPTITCLGVGPYNSEVLDQISKDMFNLKPL